MKTSNIIAVALAATLYTAGLTSCGDDYDDTSIKDQISALDKRVTTLEDKVKTDIAGIQAAIATINGNDFVKSVKEVEGGYEITFSKGTVAVIKNGTNGATPVLTAAKDADGYYYWQVNGSWLMDGTSKVPASRTPEIKAVADEDGKNYWQIDGEWLLDASGNKVLVTADAEPVKFDAVVDAEAGTITFKFKQEDGTTKDYVVNLPKSDLVIVEAGTPGVIFVDEVNVYTVAIPAGWEDAVVRADVASDDANGTSITRTGSWTSFKVDKTTSAGNATIKATPAGYAGGEIAELTVTMTNGKEKLVGSIFVKMAEKVSHDFSTGSAGDIAAALTNVETPVYYDEITVSGSTSMNDADWAALKSYPYATSLTISNTSITEVPANALEGNTVLTTFAGNASMTEIGANAFAVCTALSAVNTVGGVTTLGANAFEGTALTAMPTFAAGMVTVPASAFKNCASLSTVTWTNIASVGASAFEGTALTTVTFAKDMTAIGANAFSGCPLTAVEFSVTVTEANLEDIADNAFAGVVDNTPKRGVQPTNATLTFANGQTGVEAAAGPTAWKGYTWASITIKD